MAFSKFYNKLTSISDLHLASEQPKHLAALASQLQCTICLERLREPRMLNCLHSLCTDCVLQYTQTTFKSGQLEASYDTCSESGQLTGWITCPNCRLATYVGLFESGISLPRALTQPLVEEWVQRFDTMNKQGIVPIRKVPIESKLGYIETCLRQALSRLDRLNAYETEIRRQMLLKVDELKKIHTGPNANLPEGPIYKVLENDFEDGLHSLWRSRLQTMRESDKWRAVRCIVEIINASNKLPPENILDPLLKDMDSYTAGILKPQPRERLESDDSGHSSIPNINAICSYDPDADEDSLTCNLWKTAFYESALKNHGPNVNGTMRLLGDGIGGESRSDVMQAEVVWSVEERGEGPAQFFWPVDVAFLEVHISGLDDSTPAYRDVISQGTKTVKVVAVCDKNNRRVQLLDTRLGRYLGCFSKGVKVKRVAQDTSGTIFVSDEEAACVKVFSSDLKLISRWGDNLFKHPAGMAVTPRGEVVMTDAELCFVSLHQPFDPDTNPLNLANTVRAPGEPVKVLSGDVINKFTTRRTTSLKLPNPYYVAVDGTDDTIYVSDSYNHLVEVYIRSGTCLQRIENLSCPRGLCLDANRNLFVADSQNHRVVLFSNLGKLLQVVLRDLSNPLGLAYSPSLGLLAVTQAGYTTAHAVTLYRITYNETDTLSVKGKETAGGELTAVLTSHVESDKKKLLR